MLSGSFDCLLITSIGVAGIPSASLVAILLILKSSGIPGAETAVVALLFARLGLVRTATANSAIVLETTVFLFGGILAYVAWLLRVSLRSGELGASVESSTHWAIDVALVLAGSGRALSRNPWVC